MTLGILICLEFILACRTFENSRPISTLMILGSVQIFKLPFASSALFVPMLLRIVLL